MSSLEIEIWMEYLRTKKMYWSSKSLKKKIQTHFNSQLSTYTPNAVWMFTKTQSERSKERASACPAKDPAGGKASGTLASLELQDSYTWEQLSGEGCCKPQLQGSTGCWSTVCTVTQYPGPLRRGRSQVLYHTTHKLPRKSEPKNHRVPSLKLL